MKDYDEPVITHTSVHIAEHITHEIAGKHYAKTIVGWIIDGVPSQETAVKFEEITPDGPVPSAAYDYTLENLNNKVRDDWEYIKSGNPKDKVKYGSNAFERAMALSIRDDRAPDNLQNRIEWEEFKLIMGTRGLPRNSGSTTQRSIPIEKKAPTISKVKTPYGNAAQATSVEALAVRSAVESGGKLYKIGKFGKSETTEAQFWATENPLINPKAYAKKYGVPVENIMNADFVEIGTLKPGTNFITRPAPPAPGSPAGSGGGIEVVTPANGVQLESFHVITPKK